MQLDPMLREDGKHAYDTRIIAYADILGWADATKDQRQFLHLLGLLRSIANHADNFSARVKDVVRTTRGIPDESKSAHQGIEFSYFSDSFAVSAPVDHGRNLFRIVAFATDNLLRARFLVRGGITIGYLWHDQNVVFGPALVEAVKIEKKDALYPRFLCSDAVVNYLDSTNYKDDVVLRDCCGDGIANTVCGSLIACDELIKIIEDSSPPSEHDRRKWRYAREMLPKMYDNLVTRNTK